MQKPNIPLVERALEIAQKGNLTLTITTADPSFFSDVVSSSIRAIKPCPCGYFNHSRKQCKCTPKEIENHQKNMPDADMRIQAPEIRFKDLKLDGLYTQEAKELLKMAMSEVGLTWRELESMEKVSLTIAEMSKDKIIKPEYLAEALQYRLNENLR